MRSSNPTASQGRGFDVASPPPRFRTNRRRAAFLFTLAAALTPLSVGCETLPAVTHSGTTARLVAAVEAGDVAAEPVLLAGVR